MINKLEEVYKSENRKYLMLILSIWIMSFIIDIWPIIFLALFCVANAMLLSVFKHIQAPIDIEMITFPVVLMTIKYGLLWGIALAILSSIFHIIYNKEFSIAQVFFLMGYFASAFLASFFHGINIVLLGVLITVVINFYFAFISRFVIFYSNHEVMIATVSNVFFNIALFIGFSEVIIRIML